MLGDSEHMGPFTFPPMFNIHNSKNLAGYGYFPPLIFQALTTQCSVDTNPVDGTRLESTPQKKFLKYLMYTCLGIILFLFLVL